MIRGHASLKKYTLYEEENITEYFGLNSLKHKFVSDFNKMILLDITFSHPESCQKSRFHNAVNANHLFHLVPIKRGRLYISVPIIR